ncbi:MAG: M15 family metallopeptidase [Candidatus Acidiferrales bacterium]
MSPACRPPVLIQLAAAGLALSVAWNAAAQSEPPQHYGHRAYDEARAEELKPAGKYRDTGRVVQLAAPAAAAFKAMQKAAASDGVKLVPISGFRARDYQAGLFRRAVRRHGSEERAARWVAPPGYSEHHTGLALDIGDEARRECDVELCFEKTPAHTWLQKNAARFGFELSFPGRESGPAFEPWHWRYIGDDASRTLFRERNP